LIDFLPIQFKDIKSSSFAKPDGSKRSNITTIENPNVADHCAEGAIITALINILLVLFLGGF